MTVFGRLHVFPGPRWDLQVMSHHLHFALYSNIRTLGLDRADRVDKPAVRSLISRTGAGRTRRPARAAPRTVRGRHNICWTRTRFGAAIEQSRHSIIVLHNRSSL